MLWRLRDVWWHSSKRDARVEVEKTSVSTCIDQKKQSAFPSETQTSLPLVCFFFPFNWYEWWMVCVDPRLVTFSHFSVRSVAHFSLFLVLHESDQSAVVARPLTRDRASLFSLQRACCGLIRAGFRAGHCCYSLPDGQVVAEILADHRRSPLSREVCEKSLNSCPTVPPIYFWTQWSIFQVIWGILLMRDSASQKITECVGKPREEFRPFDEESILPYYAAFQRHPF